MIYWLIHPKPIDIHIFKKNLSGPALHKNHIRWGIDNSGRPLLPNLKDSLHFKPLTQSVLKVANVGARVVGGHIH